MRSLLVSIKPKWVAKILNGQKTLEIRKSRPKCELPCEVYIYCTKDKNELRLFDKEICEQFKSDRARAYSLAEQECYTAFIDRKSVPCNGKVVAKFTLNKVEEIERNQFSIHRTRTLTGTGLCGTSCLTPTQLSDYLRSKKGYAWHIDNLVILDEPKELKDYGVKCSPQSYCFCEVNE